MRRLKSEVDSKLSKSGTKTDLPLATPVTTDIKKSAGPEKWTHDQVKDWYARKNIDPLIVAYLSVCNGQVLKQLHEMKQLNRQFYDQSLNKIENLNMMAIVAFNAALEELFSDDHT